MSLLFDIFLDGIRLFDIIEPCRVKPASMARRLAPRHLRQTKHKRSGQTIQKIIDAECKDRQINERELKAGGKRSSVSAARAVIACRCQKELGSSAAEIARHLGVNTSSIVRSIERMEKGK